MAIGAALLFNIKLPINFNSPYKALNIQDFWRRWHITLSRFLRDYIYIPLGGNRKGRLRTYVNLMATFIIGGIWHGAGWTFVFWGFLHGVALVIHRIWSELGFKMNKILAWFITFNFINITWVFFRAKDWDDALKVLKGMFGLSGIVLPNFLLVKLGFLTKYGVGFDNFIERVGDKSTILFLLLGFILILAFKNSIEKMISFQPSYQKIIKLIFILLLSFYSMIAVKTEFLYFNF